MANKFEVKNSDDKLMDIENGNDSGVRMMVMGVGGAGNSVVRRIAAAGVRLDRIQYVAVNTDRQALNYSGVDRRILLGQRGLGAGSKPEVAKKAAEESESDLRAALEGVDLLFITAGMGGGTGTGASPVIAKLAKERNILVIAVVSTPFSFERGRHEKARAGVEELRKHVDALVVVDNSKLTEIVERLEAGDTTLNIWEMADEPLHQSIEGIAETVLGFGSVVNTDFADLQTVLSDQGIAHIALGSAKGGKEIGLRALKNAMDSPLTNTSIRGAKYVLCNVSASTQLSDYEYIKMGEAIEAACSIDGVTFPDVIHGKNVDPDLDDEVRVTLIATGMPEHPVEPPKTERLKPRDPEAPRQEDPNADASAYASRRYIRGNTQPRETSRRETGRTTPPLSLPRDFDR
ncbi:MAG: cell division protein FtsZ [Bacillota bacterium]|nr:cell division protein FtsZ [Bacillota bacterium]